MDVDLEIGLVWIDLGDLSIGEVPEHRIEAVIEILEATTSMRYLEIIDNYRDYNPTLANYRLFIEPLCRCIANLRSRSNDHPLSALSLRTNLDADTINQFLIAAKQVGIRQLVISGNGCLAFRNVSNICRNNNNLEELTLFDVEFDAGILGPSTNDGMLDSSVLVALRKLTLHKITFANSIEATDFATLLAHMRVSELELGNMQCADADIVLDNEEDIDHIKGIVSRMQFPATEQLTLKRECRLEHFKAALETGTSSITRLDVAINFDEGEAIEKQNLLGSFCRGAAKLVSLTFRIYSALRISQRPDFLIDQALKECATVTTIRVSASYLDIDSPHLFGIRWFAQCLTYRNVKLGRFVANPSAYPTEDLFDLMSRFDNCPSGRYMLCRQLPAVFPFHKRRVPMLKMKRKHDDMEETNRKRMLGSAHFPEQRSLLSGKLDRASESLNTRTEQQEEPAALHILQNGNEARIGVCSLLHDASNNGAAPESTVLNAPSYNIHLRKVHSKKMKNQAITKFFTTKTK